MLTAALAIGIVVSLVLTELIGLTAGGIIVPGYVALLLDRPTALAGFLVVAAASYGIVRALSMVLMLYGSRRFAVAVLTGLTLGVGAQWASLSAPLYVEWVGLGLIVPGLLARHAGFKRQAVRRLRSRTATAALAELAAAASAGAMIWGVGNYRGIGARLIAQLQAPTLPSPASGGG